MNQYNCDPKLNKKQAGEHAFMAGFLAARKMCAVMGRIAQLEGKDAQAEILKVGTEEVSGIPTGTIPPELSDVIIDTLN
jgi:hypothetical protein